MPSFRLPRRWVTISAVACLVLGIGMVWYFAYESKPKRETQYHSLQDFELGNRNLDARLVEYIKLCAPKLDMNTKEASTLASRLVGHEECRKRNIELVVRIYEVNRSEYIAICQGGDQLYIDFAVVFSAYKSNLFIDGIIVMGAV